MFMSACSTRRPSYSGHGPSQTLKGYMGGCQNYGPFLGTLNTTCRIIIGIQKRDHNTDNHPYIGVVII